MRKTEKIKLIGELVEHSYKKERYQTFLKEILDGEILDENSELVGELVQKDEKVGLFQIECRDLKDFFKGGRIQRNYLASLMKKKYKGLYRKALAAFYSRDSKLWRFSLVSLEKARAEENIEPYRMISHIMGSHRRNQAAFEMISLLLEKPKKKDDKGIDLIFNQEKFMEIFFKRYSSKFFSLKEDIEKSNGAEEISKELGVEKEKISHALAKKVLFQLIVLYYLQKKGWLGAAKGKALEEGDLYFIENLYNKCIKEGKNFFSDYLPILYKKGFSTYKGGEYYLEEFQCQIPYFNIELFKTYLDLEKYIKVENSFFYNEGEGILDIFDMYYFSLVENEPYLQDMVVDPEMIGKIFENLLETGYRKSKGTYYTPREIVHFMCKEVLTNYLYTNLKGVKEKDVKNFVFIGEFFLAEDKEKIKRGKTEELKIPKDIYRRLGDIEKLLSNIKIVEPSVGSGAFLLGMMGELLKRRKIVRRYRTTKKAFTGSRENFLLKSKIIKNNLYGADIEYLAVESSKLRMWLSLLVDAQNYDFDDLSKSNKNIVQGNSLTMNWEETFPEVLKSEKGFDIVIGNPPYVGEKGNKEIFREIAKTPLGEKYYMGRGDIFYYFFHLGLDILKDKGTLAYITTNYYITADGALKLREDIRQRSNILEMIDFNEINIFSKARGQHNIISILEKSTEKTRVGKTSVCSTKGDLSLGDMAMYLNRRYKGGSYSTLNQEEFYEGKENYIRLEKNSISEILHKIAEQSIPLKNVVNVNQGIVSGADKVTTRHIDNFRVEGVKGEGIFSLTSDEAKTLHLNSYEEKILGKFFKNSHIERYITHNGSDRVIIYITKNDELKDYPNIERHLMRFKSVLENKREAKQGRLPWYSLHWSREKEIFLSEKIVAPQRSRRNVFAYNDVEWYASADVYYMTIKKGSTLSLKYILALLNSKLYYLWLYKRGKRKGELLELYATPLERIPIKNISPEKQRKFITLVEEIINKRKAEEESMDLESKVDEMVCELYNLTSDEVNEVYNFYEGKIRE